MQHSIKEKVRIELLHFVGKFAQLNAKREVVKSGYKILVDYLKRQHKSELDTTVSHFESQLLKEESIHIKRANEVN